MADKSMLDLMREQHIFEVELIADGDFFITECCDRYWLTRLTAAQMEQLGLEMIALAKLAKQETQIVSAVEKTTMTVTVGGGSEWRKYD